MPRPSTWALSPSRPKAHWAGSSEFPLPDPHRSEHDLRGFLSHQRRALRGGRHLLRHSRASTTAPLHAPGRPGAERQRRVPSTAPARSRPTTFNASNYWVDVVFAHRARRTRRRPTVERGTPGQRRHRRGAGDRASTAHLQRGDGRGHRHGGTVDAAQSGNARASPTRQLQRRRPAPRRLTPDGGAWRRRRRTPRRSRRRQRREGRGRQCARGRRSRGRSRRRAPVMLPVLDLALIGDAQPADGERHRVRELGVRFPADVPARITGLRFYKCAGNTGMHTGTLWSATGPLLATVTFPGETASGWQQANFASPVPGDARTRCTSPRTTPNGQLRRRRDVFAATSVDNGPLHALSTGGGGSERRVSTPSPPSGSRPDCARPGTTGSTSCSRPGGSGPADTTPPTVTFSRPRPGCLRCDGRLVDRTDGDVQRGRAGRELVGVSPSQGREQRERSRCDVVLSVGSRTFTPKLRACRGRHVHPASPAGEGHRGQHHGRDQRPLVVHDRCGRGRARCGPTQ